MPPFFQQEEDRILLQIQVIPKSSVTQWGKVLEGARIQLKITAPPVDGAANKAVIQFIAKEFRTNKGSVTILQGEKSRSKTIAIERFSTEKVAAFLEIYQNNGSNSI